MAYKEPEIVKLYYSIGEVCSMFDVAPSLIRFWETEFDIIHPKKSRNGNRQFTEADIKNIRTIYHLVKERGFTLHGAKEALKQNAEGLKSRVEVMDTLSELRALLCDLRKKIR